MAVLFSELLACGKTAQAQAEARGSPSAWGYKTPVVWLGPLQGPGNHDRR